MNNALKLRNKSNCQISKLKYDINTYDWNIIQEEYDKGKSINDLNITKSLIYKAQKLNLIKLRNLSDAQKNKNKIKGTYKHTEETKKKLAKNGGYKKGSGRGKSGWYKGYWCDSTWELAWVIFNLDNGIIFKRFDNNFEYVYENKTYKYYPDFILDDNKTIIEIKSYETEKDLCKYTGVDYRIFNLKILKKSDIEPLINYVKVKYQLKNISVLYETYENIKEKKIKTNINHVCKCGNYKSKQSKLCNICFKLSLRKTKRPPLQILIKDILKFGYVGTGKKYGVSDNSIRKWIK